MGKAKRLRKMKSARKMARKWSSSAIAAMSQVFCVQLEAMRYAINSRSLVSNYASGGMVKPAEPIKVSGHGPEIVLSAPNFTVGKDAFDSIAKAIKAPGCTISVSDRNDLKPINKVSLPIQSNDFCDYCERKSDDVKCLDSVTVENYSCFKGKKVVGA